MALSLETCDALKFLARSNFLGEISMEFVICAIIILVVSVWHMKIWTDPNRGGGEGGGCDGF